MTRRRNRAKAQAEALLTGAQRRMVIALNAERGRIVEAMDEVMEAFRVVAQAAGMVGEGPFDFMQRGEGMFVVVSLPPPGPPRSGGGDEEVSAPPEQGGGEMGKEE